MIAILFIVLCTSLVGVGYCLGLMRQKVRREYVVTVGYGMHATQPKPTGPVNTTGPASAALMHNGSIWIYPENNPENITKRKRGRPRKKA